MSSSKEIATSAWIFGAVFAGGICWFIPSLGFGAWLLLTVIIAAIVYPLGLQMVANEKIIDRGDWPTKD